MSPLPSRRHHRAGRRQASHPAMIGGSFSYDGENHLGDDDTSEIVSQDETSSSDDTDCSPSQIAEGKTVETSRNSANEQQAQSSGVSPAQHALGVGNTGSLEEFTEGQPASVQNPSGIGGRFSTSQSEGSERGDSPIVATTGDSARSSSSPHDGDQDTETLGDRGARTSAFDQAGSRGSAGSISTGDVVPDQNSVELGGFQGRAWEEEVSSEGSAEYLLGRPQPTCVEWKYSRRLLQT